ncbi:hypothetical protein IV203_032877 [Nitzschia inconspicua]|uniref:Uncharacterized protein n=1 Tax=Nitzschia inconspicua TaxID=303405 RepID=A0A9K3KL67_9STRA|nr:hypothetical protein IV203_032877 [Nitzschia inconspicua]
MLGLTSRIEDTGHNILEQLRVRDAHNQQKVSHRLGVELEDLMPKKAFLKQCMEEALVKQKEDDEEEESEEESLPDESEIEDAAKKLSKKVDLGKTSFTKFMKLLADELNVEDLTPAQLVIY